MSSGAHVPQGRRLDLAGIERPEHRNTMTPVSGPIGVCDTTGCEFLAREVIPGL